MKRARALAIALTPLLLGGCAIGLGKSLHEYSLNESLDTHGERARPVEAEAEQNVILATTDTDFSDQAYRELLARCPNGRIVNITASYATELGFFAYKNVMKLRGTCLE